MTKGSGSQRSALQVGRHQLVAHRIHANDVARRLPAGSFATAARYGLQDSAARAGQLSLHARVTDV